jgi:hypothetical protein
MKATKIAVIITIILVVILGGAVIYTTGDDPTDNTNDDPNPFGSNDTNNRILSNTPPGIVENENNKLEINRDELIDSHTNILEQNSATVSYVVDDSIVNTIKKENGIVHIERNTYGRISEKYSNGEYTVLSREIDGDKKYSATNSSISNEEYTHASKFKSILKYLEVETYSETEDGDVEIILQETDNMKNIKNTYGFESINSASVTFTITTEGLIKESNIKIIGEVDGAKDIKTRDYMVENIDDTDILTPNWVSEAENSASIIDGRYDIAQGWILIEHQKLATIPEGQEIKIQNSDTNNMDTVTLPDDFSKNDNLGLSLLDNGDWAVTINETPPRGSSNNASGYKIWSENNLQEYFNINIRA